MELGGCRLLIHFPLTFSTESWVRRPTFGSKKCFGHHDILPWHFISDQVNMSLSFRCGCSLRVWCVKKLVKPKVAPLGNGGPSGGRPRGQLLDPWGWTFKGHSHSLFPLCFLASEMNSLLCHAVPPGCCLHRDPKPWAHSVLPGTSRTMTQRRGLVFF